MNFLTFPVRSELLAVFELIGPSLWCDVSFIMNDNDNVWFSSQTWTRMSAVLNLDWLIGMSVFLSYCLFRQQGDSLCRRVCSDLDSLKQSWELRLLSVGVPSELVISGLMWLWLQIGGRGSWERRVWGFLGSSRSDICCHHSADLPLLHCPSAITRSAFSLSAFELFSRAESLSCSCDWLEIHPAFPEVTPICEINYSPQPKDFSS